MNYYRKMEAEFQNLNIPVMRLQMGKPKLQGLPAIYAESEEEAVSLRIYLKDSLTGIILELLYTIFSEYGAIARSVCIKMQEKCRYIYLQQ